MPPAKNNSKRSSVNHKMKLIASLTSPFARKVRIVAAEKHIEYQLVVDVPWDDDTHVPDFNPLGKVPVWVLEDGKTLFLLGRAETLRRFKAAWPHALAAVE